MTWSEWFAATLCAVFVAVSFFQLLSHLSDSSKTFDLQAGLLVFDVLFGASAFALILEGWKDAVWVYSAVLVLRGLTDRLVKRRIEPASQ